MAGVLFKRGKANGLINTYVEVPSGDTHVSTDRVIFIIVPGGSTFKAEVAKVAS